MDRRRYLVLAGVTVTGLAGCTASPFSDTDRTDDTSSTDRCPDLLDVDRTRCPAEAGGPLSVDRTSETVSGESWTLRVTVTNRATEPYDCSPFAWSVFRRVGGAWTSEMPAARVEPRFELAPGDHYAWQLVAPGARRDAADQRVFLALGPGQYAFAVPFRGPERIAAVAPFTVTG